MSFAGHIHDGVVVFDEAVSLTNGTKVRVELLPAKSGVGNWEAALKAASALENYDFDAWRKQREYDLQHASDRLL